MKTPIFVSLMLATAALNAQVPDAPGPAAPAPQPAPASGGGMPTSAAPKPAGAKNPYGSDVPVFDPGSNIVSFNNQHWNITNNEVYQARFEKYLNAPEETGKEDTDYQNVIKTILDKLAPSNVTPKSVDEAFRLLPHASGYEIDAHLCDSLADAVYSAWKAQNAGQRIAQANEALDSELKQVQWNAQVITQGAQIDNGPGGKNKDANQQWAKDKQLERDMKIKPYLTREVEIEATKKANSAKSVLNEIQTKIEFQALIVQFFMQRRFQHVLMATRFYRAVFSDGDTKLQVGKDAKELFSKSIGMPPTVGTLDSMANEAIRDVHESVDAYNYLLEKDELESATKRLGEAFTIGEYMPELRTLSREKKQRALVFTQKANQLISSIDVKDYTLAEKLVHELEKTAKDFDNSKPMAAIETARTVAGLHISKAKNAAVSGDKVTLETELTTAVEIWPRNPALKEFTDLMETQGNPAQKALVDLDQLISQHNFRQIYNDKLRFIAAAALDPKRQDQLSKILDDMGKIEAALMQADARSKNGDFAGAWENVEMAYKDFPDDSKLNGMRATLTTEAPDFVHALRNAEDMEQKDQVGSSLAWYLKAQKIYPLSSFAKDGIDRLVKKVLPES